VKLDRQIAYQCRKRFIHLQLCDVDAGKETCGVVSGLFSSSNYVKTTGSRQEVEGSTTAELVQGGGRE
jgi:hypothetical protein